MMVIMAVMIARILHVRPIALRVLSGKVLVAVEGLLDLADSEVGLMLPVLLEMVVEFAVMKVVFGGSAIVLVGLRVVRVVRVLPTDSQTRPVVGVTSWSSSLVGGRGMAAGDGAKRAAASNSSVERAARLRLVVAVGN